MDSPGSEERTEATFNLRANDGKAITKAFEEIKENDVKDRIRRKKEQNSTALRKNPLEDLQKEFKSIIADFGAESSLQDSK